MGSSIKAGGVRVNQTEVKTSVQGEISDTLLSKEHLAKFFEIL